MFTEEVVREGGPTIIRLAQEAADRLCVVHVAQFNGESDRARDVIQLVIAHDPKPRFPIPAPGDANALELCLAAEHADCSDRAAMAE